MIILLFILLFIFATTSVKSFIRPKHVNLTVSKLEPDITNIDIDEAKEREFKLQTKPSLEPKESLESIIPLKEDWESLKDHYQLLIEMDPDDLNDDDYLYPEIKFFASSTESSNIEQSGQKLDIELAENIKVIQNIPSNQRVLNENESGIYTNMHELRQLYLDEANLINKPNDRKIFLLGIQTFFNSTEAPWTIIRAPFFALKIWKCKMKHENEPPDGKYVYQEKWRDFPEIKLSDTRAITNPIQRMWQAIKL